MKNHQAIDNQPALVVDIFLGVVFFSLGICLMKLRSRWCRNLPNTKLIGAVAAVAAANVCSVMALGGNKNKALLAGASFVGAVLFHEIERPPTYSETKQKGKKHLISYIREKNNIGYSTSRCTIS